MIDLKETKRIKQALLQNPKSYQQIIENTDLAICITNNEGKFVAINQNYLQLYGYKREDLIGKAFTLVVPQEHREALMQYHARFFVDKYEILRKWEVVNNRGEIMEIFADAGYHENIEGRACKITLVQFQRIVGQVQKSGINVTSK